MTLTSYLDANTFLHIKSPHDNCADVRERLTLVYFITGNPGLIGYYIPFLSLLAKRLETQKTDVVIAGYSLGGFNVDNGQDTSHRSKDSNQAQEKTSNDNDALYDLNGQIELCYKRLDDLVRKLGGDFDKDTTRPIDVILIGHSVGTYIALEVVRLRAERTLQSKPQGVLSGHDNVSQSLCASGEEGGQQQTNHPWHVTAGILLTPTIQDMHLSPSGRLATPLLTTMPFLPVVAQVAVGWLSRLMPQSWFRGLVQRATGMKDGGHGLETTLRFLRSEKGVRQALYLAGWELREIRADRWGEEVWGLTHQQQWGSDFDGGGGEESRRSPRSYFWFAKQDHWVADVTREEILSKRGGGVGGAEGGGSTNNTRLPTILVDEDDGLVHAWCLEQSSMVAERVGNWLEDILAT
jgi:pimeloyl-ACP methyl ester carboxylesterase